MELKEEIENLIKPIIENTGCEFKKLELKFQGRNQLLTITVDKTGGVNVEDCAKISRLIEPVLDEKNLIRGKYLLVVSSPGIK